MRIVVTGGAGFVGSHIVERLLLEDHEVLIVDDLSATGKRANFFPVRGQLGHEQLDITKDPLGVLEFADLVIHAAAYADISKNWTGAAPAERLRHLNVNALGTMRVLEAMNPKAGLIFLSTASVYGTQTERVVRAADAGPDTQESPYAASKIAGEGLVFAYSHARKTPAIVLRLVNVVGSRYHHGHLADFVRMGQTGDRVIRTRDDGRQRKSFVHVKDVAALVVELVHGGRLMPVQRAIFNVASEERWSIRDSIACMGEVAVEYAEKRQGWIGDPYELAVDSRPAQRLLPGGRWLSVEAGVREALDSLGWRR